MSSVNVNVNKSAVNVTMQLDTHEKRFSWVSNCIHIHS